MELLNLPKQPSVIVSYLRVGKLLYYALFLFLLESWIYWVQLKASFLQPNLWIQGFWLWCFLFSFVHIFLVLMDGWSRFQNYKRAKDQFFEYGFRKRIAANYIVSKCQREAALVAASELGIEDKVVNYYNQHGVKWFHYLPYFMVIDPLFFLRKTFWSRTFLERSYISKYNYKELQLELTS
ncbi:hypothetical protein [Formosa sp. PL04]|uniref:hypothetical protein n=1 Tax=Formosa sp. PL04 TaxID=3081755 RepID=UPI002980C5A5|nr:hypothetical protein [Formosa sp. PL04]MDW5289832.1 hypothetical protein [Formosa sp. PL04]